MLINRNFSRLWIGQLVSLLGDFVFDTTLLLWVATVLLYGKPYAPIVSSTVLILVAVAAIAVAPFAGVLVDRWDKRRTMLRANLVRFVLIGLLALVASLPAGTVPIPVILILAGVVVTFATAAAGFFNPARIVLVGDIVPENQIGKASGLIQSTMALAAILGPPLAAPLLVTVGAQWTLALSAMSYLLSSALIRSVRPAPADVRSVTPDSHQAEAGRPGMMREFVDGLRLFRGNRVLVTLLVTTTFVMLGAGAINALDVYFVQENLHAAPEWFGLIGAAIGVGALIGSAAAGILGDRFGLARTYCASLLLASGLFLLYSRMTSIGPALIMVTLFSIGLGSLHTVSTPLVMRAVPRSHLGRVLSVFSPIAQVATVISIGVAGALVSALPPEFRISMAGVEFGRIDLVFFGSSAVMLSSAIYAAVTLLGRDRMPARADDTEPDRVETAG
ncbi:MFS transporter [Acrocarpospora corrugata]|uniref:MFS transporter n=2 Tax=Acrocarpospora corrugata TaxID=35763 RepID=A0A5M3WBK8_9ACTN|nr:MFS transporter [Acrocarpospora corrugata]